MRSTITGTNRAQAASKTVKDFPCWVLRLFFLICI